MNILMIGHRSHGKDTVCDMLSPQLKSAGSSAVMNVKIIFDTLSDLYGYKTTAECYADRDNHRAEWFELIKEFNREDPIRLAKIIFDDNDIYNGLRNVLELDGMTHAGLIDHIVWVDAAARKPLESTSSFTIGKDRADFIINNNGKESNLSAEVIKVFWRIAFPIKYPNVVKLIALPLSVILKIMGNSLRTKLLNHLCTIIANK